MSERHIYECDACGWETTVWCDGRTAARLPTSWGEVDDKDYCGDCLEEMAATRTAPASESEQP